MQLRPWTRSVCYGALLKKKEQDILIRNADTDLQEYLIRDPF